VGTGDLFPAPGVLLIKVKFFGVVTNRIRHPGNYSNASRANKVNMSSMRVTITDCDGCVALAGASLAEHEVKDTTTCIRATVAHTLVAGLNGYGNIIREMWTHTSCIGLSTVSRKKKENGHPQHCQTM
jgi:hypothetical protein